MTSSKPSPALKAALEKLSSGAGDYFATEQVATLSAELSRLRAEQVTSRSSSSRVDCGVQMTDLEEAELQLRSESEITDATNPRYARRRKAIIAELARLRDLVVRQSSELSLLRAEQITASQHESAHYYCGCGAEMGEALKCPSCSIRRPPRRSPGIPLDQLLADVLAMEDSAVEALLRGCSVPYRSSVLQSFVFAGLPEHERPVARAYAALAIVLEELPESAEKCQSLLRLADSLRFALEAARSEKT